MHPISLRKSAAKIFQLVDGGPNIEEQAIQKVRGKCTYQQGSQDIRIQAPLLSQ